jgi:hypothetical protein
MRTLHYPGRLGECPLSGTVVRIRWTRNGNGPLGAWHVHSLMGARSTATPAAKLAAKLVPSDTSTLQPGHCKGRLLAFFARCQRIASREELARARILSSMTRLVVSPIRGSPRGYRYRGYGWSPVGTERRAGRSAGLVRSWGLTRNQGSGWLFLASSDHAIEVIEPGSAARLGKSCTSIKSCQLSQLQGSSRLPTAVCGRET